VIAANPLSPPFKVLLDAIGAVLAFLYRYIPNYGVSSFCSRWGFGSSSFRWR